ncbi:MAG: orotidine-5'-phosphate decarboxylase [Promethearchaeota archaeon]
MSTTNFKSRVVEKILQKGTVACVGLDPDVNAPGFPSFLRERRHAKLEFARAILDEIHDLVPAVKPNTRFFSPDEAGDLRELVRRAHALDLEVVGDCKENDVGSTVARAYESHFEWFGFDAITVNPYFGHDGVVGEVDDPEHDLFGPWATRGKGLFVLVKTSNPGSAEFQDLPVVPPGGGDPLPLYLVVAREVERWSARYDHAIGAVVGATHPGQLAVLRAELGGLILAPGYGAQGATAADLASATDGERFCLVNSSRAVMYAHARRFQGQFREEDFAKAARAEVERMREQLASLLRADLARGGKRK